MELLTEKYRPKTLEDLVNPTGDDKTFIEKLKSWKEKNQLDGHLIFYGPPGTGKSSTVRVIINELGITDVEIVNGSDKTSVDDMRKLIDYASIPPLNSDSIKLVVIEEFERLSQQAQDSLKFVLEQYSSWCRFIFTTNNYEKVTAPIKSRCEAFNFKNLNKEEFVNKIVTILNAESIKFTLDDIAEYIKVSHPDLRKCINLITKNVKEKGYTKELLPFNNQEIISCDKFDDVLKHYMKTGDIIQTRTFINSEFSDEDYEKMYDYMFRNLELLTSNKDKWDELLVKIAEYLFKHSSVAYYDLNLMACLIELRGIINK